MNAVDTNVLVYAYDESSSAKRDVARELLIRLQDGVLLWQVACEFIAASRKLQASDADAGLAWNRLAELMAMFALVTPDESVLRVASELHVRSRVQLWDAILIAACLRAGVTRLYTEDTPGTSIPGLEIVNPFA